MLRAFVGTSRYAFWTTLSQKSLYNRNQFNAPLPVGDDCKIQARQTRCNLKRHYSQEQVVQRIRLYAKHTPEIGFL